jgi:hypothetical protein
MIVGRIEGMPKLCFEMDGDAHEAVRIGRKVFIHVGHGIDEIGRYQLYRKVVPATVKLITLKAKR